MLLNATNVNALDVYTPVAVMSGYMGALRRASARWRPAHAHTAAAVNGILYMEAASGSLALWRMWMTAGWGPAARVA